MQRPSQTFSRSTRTRNSSHHRPPHRPPQLPLAQLSRNTSYHLDTLDTLDKRPAEVVSLTLLCNPRTRLMLNDNASSSNPITKVPLVIATTMAFFAVVLHWLTSLQFHVFESVSRSLPLINPTSSDIRPGSPYQSYQALSCGLGRIFGLVRPCDPRRLSWSQTECNPHCWANVPWC